MIIDERDFPPLPLQIRRLPNTRNDATTSTSSSSATATFNDLPDELILKILDYLPPMGTRDVQPLTFIRLSRTNRRLYRIVTATIYKTFDSTFCRPYPFLRTIICNPQIAELVQHVCIVFGAWTGRETGHYDPTAQDKKVIKEGIRALGTRDWKAWAADCNTDDRNFQALYPVLLMHTPNITSLVVHDVDRRERQILRWIGVIAQAALGVKQGRMHAFEHLQSITVHMEQISLLQVAPLFRLASLRRFVALQLVEESKTNGSNISALQRSMPITSNNIEEFRLEDECFISMEKLAVVLQSSRRLKSFSYDLSPAHLENEDSAEEQLGPTTFSAVLYPHREFLESLRLTTSIPEERFPGVLHLKQGLGKFQSLRHLTCPLIAINKGDADVANAFSETFPPSLETLHMAFPWLTPGDIRIRYIEQLASHHDILAPALKVLHVSPRNPADWQRCESLCLKSGLEFKVDKAPRYWNMSWGFDTDFSSSSCSSDEVDLYSDDEV